MNYYDLMAAATAEIEKLGFSVVMLPADSELYGASVDYDTKTVSYNCTLAKIAAVLLFHELGHCLHWQEDNNLERSCSRKLRERQAFVRGWQALQQYDIEQLISLRYWCMEAIEDAYL